MATLLLSAVGTLVGGPIGGVVGALAGRQIDAQIIGSPTREGPRLKELTVSTSTYGTPIARVHGSMRMPGTIIWATDLMESRESNGGGKGQPKTTTYSYSASFAIAVSSRPIQAIGRIWADGNLLRGAAGDLKSRGTMRVHNGRGDQSADPHVASAEGDRCPAFRNCAYVVFEDLDLTEFGNRIPALSFEVIADSGEVDLAAILPETIGKTSSEVSLYGLDGYAIDGGPIRSAVDTLGYLFPFSCDASEQVVRFKDREEPVPAYSLPESARAWEDGDFGTTAGQRAERLTSSQDEPKAVRYYDPARDYQPGIQRAIGPQPATGQDIFDLPAALSAVSAKSLTEKAMQRGKWRKDRLSWRIAELDPTLTPGTLVTVPQYTGAWVVEGWEWRERGVELELVRQRPGPARTGGADTGTNLAPADILASALSIDFFELPAESTTTANTPQYFFAASATGRPAGVSIYHSEGGGLEPLAAMSRTDSVQGTLAFAVDGSPSLRFERNSAISVSFDIAPPLLANATPEALARGANRLLVGTEIVQFSQAKPLGNGVWELCGLLRGRGGTESAAQAGHGAGTRVVLLDDRLLQIETAPGNFIDGQEVAAIGGAASEPVMASLRNYGASLTPLPPVHARAGHVAGVGLDCCWKRRARGAWLWPTNVEVPLVEEREEYLLGIGSINAPDKTWISFAPDFLITESELSALPANIGGAPLWVRQVGTFAVSSPVLITNMP